MADQISTKPDEFGTVLGPDAQFKGELSFTGGVRVEGQFEGSITTQGKVLIAKTGRIKAEVKAGQVVLDGQVEGNVVAEDRVDIRSTATLRGDLKASKLLVAEGATWIGRCEVGPAVGASVPPKHPAEPVLRTVAPVPVRH